MTHKEYWKARNAHLFFFVIGLFATWVGTSTLKAIINGEDFNSSVNFCLGFIVVGSILMGASLQSLFRLKKSKYMVLKEIKKDSQKNFEKLTSQDVTKKSSKKRK